MTSCPYRPPNRWTAAQHSPLKLEKFALFKPRWKPVHQALKGDSPKAEIKNVGHANAITTDAHRVILRCAMQGSSAQLRLLDHENWSPGKLLKSSPAESLPLNIPRPHLGLTPSCRWLFHHSPISFFLKLRRNNFKLRQNNFFQSPFTFNS